MSGPANNFSRAESFWRAARRSFAPLAFVVVALVAFWMCASGRVGAYAIAAMAIGGAVGAVELLGRYRHAPLRATLNWSGVFYILINILASWAAYFLLATFSVFDLAKDAEQVKAALTAGFGSLVFMRSSIFNVRVGESDIGIGPAAILDTLLLVADRGVDRREAVARAQDVSALVSQVRDPRIVAKMLTKYSLALMQNVDEKTSQDLGDAIGKILGDPEIPDTIKMDIVALRLGIVVGPDVLEAAVSALGDRLNMASAPPSAIAGAAAAAAAGTPSVADLKAEIDAAKAKADVEKQA